jgi:hypothetical protein
MGMKNFLMKKMLKNKMKDVPDAEIDKMVGMIEKNPEFFKKIGDEIEAEVKKGKDQTAATMLVMKKHQAEMQKMMM